MNTKLHALARLRAAVARLGLGRAVELLRTSGISQFEKLSDVTLSRWQSGRAKEKFPGRAELATRLLETAMTSVDGQVTLTYAVVPNPASIPLVFLRSLVPQLETDLPQVEAEADSRPKVIKPLQ